MIENTFGLNLVPDDDEQRLAALRRYRILETPSEESLDNIAQLATKIFNVPISLLSLVDAELVFFKANVGMGDAKIANRGKSLCALAVLDTDVTVFEDALAEPCLLANPNVAGSFGLRFYAGAPLITSDGYVIGTLCIIDKVAREFSSNDKSILEGLAKTAMHQIELRLSSLRTIDEANDVNESLIGSELKLKTLLEELARTNKTMEGTNDELILTNNSLVISNDLAVVLNTNLRESEMKFRTFIEKAPVAFGILTGRELVIEVANDLLLKVWGKRRSIVNEKLVKALPELIGQPYLKILDKVFTTGESYTGKEASVQLEFEGVLKTFFFDFIYEPLKDEQNQTLAIIVIANDVTERINNKRELETLNHQLKVALNAGKLGSYNLNIATGIMTCSEKCKANFGLLPDDTLNFPELINSIVPEYRDFVNQKVEASISNNMLYDVEYAITWPDGSLHWISASGLPSYDDEGKPTYITGVTVDITDRKFNERQKDDFLSIASHELKTPITTLKATLQLLSRYKDQPGHAIIPRLIDQSLKSMDKISSLVDELLNINRISEGQLRLNKTTFSIAEMLDSCCNHVREEGKYNLIIKGDLNIEITADEHRIDQVIVNFVNNAVKYAPQSKDIFLIIEKEDGCVKVIVEDNGEGIEAEVQPYIFDRYYRVNHKGEAYSGLGLGLYICSQIIKAHGGEIGVESVVGAGSKFWFTLPLVS